MVKKIGKFFAYLLFFLLALMYFTPKESVYYFAEKQLKPFGVLISSEDAIDRGLCLELNHANISFKAIESASVESAKIKLLGALNSFEVQNIKLASTASSFVPLHIENVKITHHIFNPLHVSAEANGEFGELSADVDLLERTLHIDFIASKEMKKNYKSTLRNLKKNQKGEYYYDQSF